jgi:hypothetical protein
MGASVQGRQMWASFTDDQRQNIVGSANVLSPTTRANAHEPAAAKILVDNGVDPTGVLFATVGRGQDLAGDGLSPFVRFRLLSMIHDDLVPLLGCVPSRAPQITAVPARVTVTVAAPRHPDVHLQREMIHAEHGYPPETLTFGPSAADD